MHYAFGSKHWALGYVHWVYGCVLWVFVFVDWLLGCVHWPLLLPGWSARERPCPPLEGLAPPCLQPDQSPLPWSPPRQVTPPSVSLRCAAAWTCADGPEPLLPHSLQGAICCWCLCIRFCPRLSSCVRWVLGCVPRAGQPSVPLALTLFGPASHSSATGYATCFWFFRWFSFPRWHDNLQSRSTFCQHIYPVQPANHRLPSPSLSKPLQPPLPSPILCTALSIPLQPFPTLSDRGKPMRTLHNPLHPRTSNPLFPPSFSTLFLSLLILANHPQPSPTPSHLQPSYALRKPLHPQPSPTPSPLLPPALSIQPSPTFPNSYNRPQPSTTLFNRRHCTHSTLCILCTLHTACCTM